MTRKRIVLIAPFTGVTGGIMKWANNVYSHYQDVGDEGVELIPFDFSRKRSGQMAKNLVSRIFSFLTDYVKLTMRAMKFVRKSLPDIIHITTPAGALMLKDLILIRQAHGLRKKAVVHFHFGRIPELFAKGGWELVLLKHVLSSADKVVVMDQNSFLTLKSRGYNNIEDVPNPISSEVIALAGGYADGKVPRTILFAGHVIPTKGVEELILACRNIPDIHVKILGAVAPAYRNQLEILAGDGNEKWLDICGEVDYKTTVLEMCKSSLFVLPTHTEGFPNVILESMACGCSIVSTTVGAIPEMLSIGNEENECGIAVSPKDVNFLQDAIERMLYDKPFAERCSRNARAKVSNYYSMLTVWGLLAEVWDAC